MFAALVSTTRMFHHLSGGSQMWSTWLQDDSASTSKHCRVTPPSIREQLSVKWRASSWYFTLSAKTDVCILTSPWLKRHRPFFSQLPVTWLFLTVVRWPPRPSPTPMGPDLVFMSLRTRIFFFLKKDCFIYKHQRLAFFHPCCSFLVFFKFKEICVFNMTKSQNLWNKQIWLSITLFMWTVQWSILSPPGQFCWRALERRLHRFVTVRVENICLRRSRLLLYTLIFTWSSWFSHKVNSDVSTYFVANTTSSFRLPWFNFLGNQDTAGEH